MISKEEEIFLLNLKANIDYEIVCLDIGANKGFYSSSLLDIIGDKIHKLYCFEPVPENFKICIDKFGDNKKVDLFMNACSNIKNRSKFFQVISDNENKNKIGLEGLSSLNNRAVFNELNVREIEVDCVVLNDVLNIEINRKIFTKIDVEGYELEVLEGMSSFFESEQILAIQFEYGNCMLERNKDLNDIQKLLSIYPKYHICDFNELNNKLIPITEDNIHQYINSPWSILYITKKSYV